MVRKINCPLGGGRGKLAAPGPQHSSVKSPFMPHALGEPELLSTARRRSRTPGEERPPQPPHVTLPSCAIAHQFLSALDMKSAVAPLGSLWPSPQQDTLPLASAAHVLTYDAHTRDHEPPRATHWLQELAPTATMAPPLVKANVQCPPSARLAHAVEVEIPEMRPSPS